MAWLHCQDTRGVIKVGELKQSKDMQMECLCHSLWEPDSRGRVWVSDILSIVEHSGTFQARTI